MERERIGSEERIFTPERSRLAEKLGLVEILPEERERLDDIRWTAYKVRTALRLGEAGRFIFDPTESLEPCPVSIEVLATFQSGVRFLPNNDCFNRFCQLFPDTDPIYLRGVLRRVLHHPACRKQLKCLTSDPDENLGWALSVLKKDLTPPIESQSTQPPVLIVAHKSNFNIREMMEKILDESRLKAPSREKLSEKLADLVTTVSFAFATPYIGASVIMAELENCGFKNMKIVDYHDCLDGSVERTIDKLNPQVALLTGALSFDIADLPPITEGFSKRGIRTVIGGLGPTIDPIAILRATDASVFVGECEDAIKPMMEILQSANPSDRFIFRRYYEGSPVSWQESDKSYVLFQHPDFENTWDVYFNLPKFVDRKKYYAPEKERTEALAQRLRLEMRMRPTLRFFQKEYDAPLLGEQISTSVGCPECCFFCATGIAHGWNMRRLPIESLLMRIDASESRYLVATDQNFGAISKNETEEEYLSWMRQFLSRLEENGQRLLCQTEPEFFERTAEDPEMASLVSKTIGVALLGLEQPEFGVRGSFFKDPEALPGQIAAMKDMGVVSWGSGVVGLPPNFCLGADHIDSVESSISREQWEEWLDGLGLDALVLFPFIFIPGAPGCRATEMDDTDPLFWYANPKHTQEALETTAEVMGDFYRFRKILSRILRTKGYSRKRKGLVLLLNLGIKLFYASDKGLERFRDILK